MRELRLSLDLCWAEVVFILCALEVEHFVGLLPAEQDRGDDDEEHVEGDLEVDLLPGDRLLVNVQLSVVRGDDEAHYGGQS